MNAHIICFVKGHNHILLQCYIVERVLAAESDLVIYIMLFAQESKTYIFRYVDKNNSVRVHIVFHPL